MRQEEDEEDIDETRVLEQIAWLKGSVNRRDKLMLLLSFVSTLLLSAIVTGFIVLNKKVNKAIDAVEITITEDVAKFKSSMGNVKKLTQDYGDKVKKLELMLNNLELNEETSSLNHMKTLLIEQENNIQLFLVRMKTGSYYLARMLPGSRAWFEDHEENINKAILSSTQRKKRIEALFPAKLINNKSPNLLKKKEKSNANVSSSKLNTTNKKLK